MSTMKHISAVAASLLVVGNVMAQDISISGGWNLIGINVKKSGGVSSYTLSTDFVNQSGNIKKVQGAATSWDITKSKNSLSTLSAGNGYWVYSDASATVALSGDALATLEVSTSTDALLKSTGWNLVSIPSDVVDTDANLTNEITKFSNAGYQVTKIQGAATSWDATKSKNSLSSLSEGKGYWVYVNAITAPVSSDVDTPPVVPSLGSSSSLSIDTPPVVPTVQ